MTGKATETLNESLEAKIRYALATPDLRPDVATVLDRALRDLGRLKSETEADRG